MRWKGLVPGVRSIADRDPPARPHGPPRGPAGRADRPSPPIDRAAVQYLDRVRAIFRPAVPAPGLERFVGREDFFRHIGRGSDGTPMMECPVHWPDSVKWVPIGDLEIVEILEDQDVRAG